MQQTFMNPNYFPQYPQYQSAYGQQVQQMQQMPNPYMDRLSQLQAQQNVQPAQIPVANQFPVLGKLVESIDIVKSTDIPMDNNMYYFPKADGTEVYAKHWRPNGTTQIVTFRPVLEDESGNLQPIPASVGFSDEIAEQLMGRLDNITDRLDKFERTWSKLSNKVSAKSGTAQRKEVLEDE